MSLFDELLAQAKQGRLQFRALALLLNGIQFLYSSMGNLDGRGTWFEWLRIVQHEWIILDSWSS